MGSSTENSPSEGDQTEIEIEENGEERFDSETAMNTLIVAHPNAVALAFTFTFAMLIIVGADNARPPVAVTQALPTATATPAPMPAYAPTPLLSVAPTTYPKVHVIPVIAATAITEAVIPTETPIPSIFQQNQHLMPIVLSDREWAAIKQFAPERQYAFARIGFCESGFNEDAIGDGGDSIGAWQVQPKWWGPVPDSLVEQAKQAEAIAAEHGTRPWTTRDGCPEWR